MSSTRLTVGVCLVVTGLLTGFGARPRVLAQGTPSEIVDNAEVRRVYLGEHFRM